MCKEATFIQAREESTKSNFQSPLKGQYVLFGDKLKVSINEVIEPTQKYFLLNQLFSEEQRSPDHCFKLERWQGPPKAF